jgi:hypothetical protein
MIPYSVVDVLGNHPKAFCIKDKYYLVDYRVIGGLKYEFV